MYFCVDIFVYHSSLSLKLEQQLGRNSDQSKCREKVFESSLAPRSMHLFHKRSWESKILLVKYREKRA